MGKYGGVWAEVTMWVCGLRLLCGCVGRRGYCVGVSLDRLL